MLIHNADITGSLLVNGTRFNTGSFSGSFTGIVAGTTATASYVEYNSVANKPALVSGSSQITYSGLTGIPSGIVSGSSQVEYSGLTGIPSGIVSGSSQVTYSGLTGIPSGIVSGSAQVAALGFATTGSNGFNGSQSITGSLTVTGQVVAQTLNVQQVTSSVVYSSGSNVFGNSLSNTQQFTGSMLVTGSLTVAGAGTFSSNLTTGDILTINSNANTPYLRFRQSDSSKFFIGERSAVSGDGGTGYDIYAVAGNDLRFFAGASKALTIASTGAATFSSSVTAGGGVNAGDSKFFNSVQLTDSLGGTCQGFLWTDAANTLKIGTGTVAGGNVKLTIASTGAASFSSSVTAGSSSATNYGTLQIMGGVTSPSLTVGTAANVVLAMAAGQELAITANGTAPYGVNFQARNSLAGGGGSGTSYPIIFNPLGGNVGIGTTDPQSVLNNFSTSARGLAISNTYPFIILNDTDGGNFSVGTQGNLAYLWNGGTDAMIFATNNTERMRITSAGNVGIGTASPEAKLELRDGVGVNLRVRNNGSNILLLQNYNTADGYQDMQIAATNIRMLTTTSGAGGASEIARFTLNGLTFNGDTAAANALDDYEEGTWTPGFSGAGSPSYSVQFGTYTKIGNFVYCTIALRATSISGGDTINITGLPFAAAGVGDSGQRSTYSPRLGGHILGLSETTSKFRVTGGSTLQGVYGDGQTLFLPASTFCASGTINLTGNFSFYV